MNEEDFEQKRRRMIEIYHIEEAWNDQTFISGLTTILKANEK